jgi:hypothetical protein
LVFASIVNQISQTGAFFHLWLQMWYYKYGKLQTGSFQKLVLLVYLIISQEASE